MRWKYGILVAFGCMLAASSSFAGSLLYAPSEMDDPGLRSSISALTGDPVDYFDAQVGTPTLAQLGTYDAVFTWANYGYFDQVAFGDALADYVDAGGRVILGVFTTYTSGNFLSGRIMDVGYSPVTSPTGDNHFTNSSYAGDGTLFHSGVTTYAADFRDILVLQGGGVVAAHYADGEIAVAYRPDFRVFYVNSSGGSAALGDTGDWPQLMANIIDAGSVGPAAVSAPLPAAAVPAFLLLAGVGLLRIRSRRRRAVA